MALISFWVCEDAACLYLKTQNHVASSLICVTTVVTLILLLPYTQPDGYSFPLTKLSLPTFSPRQ